MRIRIATRGSALALWQARHISSQLQALGGVETAIVEVSTRGDRDVISPLSDIGGKGVFVKEVQSAVLEGRADIAVHSAKDLPAVTPDGLMIAAVPPRGDPRDALVGCRLVDLPEGATIATGSARRRVQLAALRPDLVFIELRGNIDTRLSKIPSFGAIVMANVAVVRLERNPSILDPLAVSQMIPQVGQGTLAVEARSSDESLVDLLSALDDTASRRALAAERAFLRRLGGDCDLPAGAHARHEEGNELRVSGVLEVGAGSILRRDTVRGVDPDIVGERLADALVNDADA